MMDWLTIIFLVYMFIALYFLMIFVLTYIKNRKEIFSVPGLEKDYSVSVLIPAYNEEESIEGTVEAVLKSDYKNLKEIIIINDGSKDDTLKIARELEKKYELVRVLDKSNSGKADSLNQAIKIAVGELIAVIDADSYPDENAIRSMAGFFSDDKVGAVTTRIFVKHRNSFMRKLQSVEYKVIAFSRKLLGFLDAIYVTPGPLALYRKEALQKVGGFDPKNMTEDIEATWHLVYEGYKIKMSFVSRVFSIAPRKFKQWFTQRIRWNVGGFQTMLKYKKILFRKNMLGFFILPYFSLSLLLGVVGLGLFSYRLFRRLIVSYLSTKNSIAADTAVLRLSELNLTPSVLNFFGVVLFLAGFLFIALAIWFVNKQKDEKENLFIVLFYSLVYMMLYPLVLITSMYKFIRGNYRWR